MDPLVWLLKNRYGSLELSRQVGPNLLRGFAGSVLLHAMVVTALFVMAMVNAGDRGKTISPIPIIDIRPAPPRSYVPPRIVPNLPRPMPPDVISHPVVVSDPPPESTVMTAPGEGGVPGDKFVPGTTTIFQDEPTPSSPVVIIEDDPIPPLGTFIAREIEPSPLEINPQPAYPEFAQISGLSGVVNVQVFVDKHGNVREWKIVKVNPTGIGFEDEVLKVIPKWKFTPAIQQDKPVGVWVGIPFKFTFKR